MTIYRVICAIYVRISTDEDLQKWSIPAQTKELIELAERRGWTVFKIYTDTISGSCSKRPGLDELRDDMAAGNFSVILVVDQDRLSRMESIDWELLKQEIREAGVKLVTPVQEVDFSDEDSELVSDVFNLFARHQRRKLKKAMRRGRAEAVRSGKWFGKAPFGRLKRDDGSLDLDPETAPVVHKIFTLYAQGYGAKRISDILKHLPGPNGGTWNNTAVIRIITNWVHRGDIVRTENGQNIHLKGVFTPTVPVELFDLCNEINRKRREECLWYKTQQVTNLASGVVTCGECGKIFNIVAIHSKFRDKSYTYYYYRHRGRKGGKVIKNTCNSFHRADVIDAKLIECIKVVGSSPEAARRLIKLSNKTSEITALKKKFSLLEKAMKSLEGKKKKLLKLYLDEDWDKASLDEQKRILTTQINNNLKEQEEISGRLVFLEEQKINLDLIVEYFAALSNIDTEMTREQQRTMIQALFPKIVIYKSGNISITARMPIGENIFFPDLTGGLNQVVGFHLPSSVQGV
ncbi:MAG: recombinase family protein [Bacillota bacterium]